MPVWSTEVANKLISMSKEKPLTHMQIQKLVYISHGWTLAIRDRILTIDDPEAWAFGPVYRLIWDNLRFAGPYPVTKKIPDADLAPYPGSTLRGWNEEDKQIVDRVYQEYKHLEAFQLSALTHRERTPWRTVYQNGEGQDQYIPSFMIKEHFQELASKS